MIVNCDEKSKDFGNWTSFSLSEVNMKQILVPPMHGVGHLILSDFAVYHYKQTSYFEEKEEFTYKWNDNRFKISWPIKNPLISERDSK